MHVEFFIDESFSSVYANLDSLPISPGAFPREIKGKINYDSRRKRLWWNARMEEWEKHLLLGLSDDANYRRAIENFFRKALNFTIYVGGPISVFVSDDTESALRKADEFDGDLARAGIRYFNTPGSDAQFTKTKKDSSADALKAAMVGSSFKYRVPEFLS